MRLTKDDRIRRPSEYRRIVQQGLGRRTAHFYIRMLNNPSGRTRLGIAAGKKVGNACARNRIKRRLREYFRLNRAKLPPGTDLMFVVLPGASAVDTRELFAELDRFFDR